MYAMNDPQGAMTFLWKGSRGKFLVTILCRGMLAPVAVHLYKRLHMLKRRSILILLMFAASCLLVSSASAQDPSTSINLNSRGGASNSAFITPNRTAPVTPPSNTAQSSGGNNAGAEGGGAGNTDIITSVYSYANINDPSAAFYGLPLAQQQLYRGLIPGVRDTLPHVRPGQIAGLKSRSNRLTWIGYQAMSDKTRIFLQTFDMPAFEVVRGEKPGELVIILQNTRPSLSNFYRRIDARWFPRAVSFVKARRVGRDTHVHIVTRRQVEFAVSVDGKYLNIDFNDAFLENGTDAGSQENAVDPNKGNKFRDPDDS